MTLLAEIQNSRIQELQDRVSALEEQVGLLLNLSDVADVEVVELREVGREQAKSEIFELFAAGETLYYSDICERLSLELDIVVEICGELESEGAIELDANAV